MTFNFNINSITPVVSGGFIIDNSKPFQYTAYGNGLYIKTNGKVSINIEG